jgi:hypothetical protein
MNYLIPSLLLIALLAACEPAIQQGPAVPDGPVTQEQIDSIVSAFSFVYEDPMELDSGTHALIPMSISNDRGKGGSYSSYEKDYTSGYWNVLFLDLRTQETHLLTDKRMRITGIHIHKREQGKVLSQHVLYSIIDEDVNNDGQFDYADAEHLSISDATGHGLTPVSPVKEDVMSWRVLDGHDRIIIITRVDTDGDRVYEQHEDANVYLYDVHTRELRRVVTDELQGQVNKLFYEQWLKEK